MIHQNFHHQLKLFQNSEKFIPLAIENLISGKNVPVYGNGLNIREWIHISDHVSALCAEVHPHSNAGWAGRRSSDRHAGQQFQAGQTDGTAFDCQQEVVHVLFIDT